MSLRLFQLSVLICTIIWAESKVQILLPADNKLDDIGCIFEEEEVEQNFECGSGSNETLKESESKFNMTHLWFAKGNQTCVILMRDFALIQSGKCSPLNKVPVVILPTKCGQDDDGKPVKCEEVFPTSN